ncbi:MAG TPA: ATP phosphoribosyltransferase [Thermoanaerobaculia bacterium]|nr:ATP phosphoribosyltransferase [Thermoanaerobaculia bacterium]
MIRLALPRGRNLAPSLAAFRAAGLGLGGFEGEGRRPWAASPEDGLEVLLLEDRDLPLYVEDGVADLGVIGSEVIEEVGADLLVPLAFTNGGCRLSLLGRPGALPGPGGRVRLATKYPRTARRLLAERPWSAEVVELSGSIELAVLLELAQVALGLVQPGRTLRDELVELEPLAEVGPRLVVNRAAFQQHRQQVNGLVSRLEAAGVAR